MARPGRASEDRTLESGRERISTGLPFPVLPIHQGPSNGRHIPLIRQARELLDRTGLLYTCDCKMAALEARVEIDASGDICLTSPPMMRASRRRRSR